MLFLPHFLGLSFEVAPWELIMEAYQLVLFIFFSRVNQEVLESCAFQTKTKGVRVTSFNNARGPLKSNPGLERKRL